MRMNNRGGVTARAKQALGFAAVAGAAGLSLAPGLALAAEADAPAIATADAGERTTDVSSVDVYGKKDQPKSDKLTAPVLDTPKSITTIPQTIIQQTGAVSLQDLLRTVPGITLASGEGGASGGDRPLIRGIEATNDTFIDGVRDSGVQSRDVFNLEQVDIIKGPSSAYSGRGSTGGSINLVTKTPKAESFYGGSITLGTDATQRVTVDLNQALTDTVAVRLNLMSHNADVAGRDATNVSRWGFAPSIAFGLGTPARITLSYYKLRSDDLPDYGIPYNTATLRPVTGHDDDFYGLTKRDFQINEADIGTLRFEYDLSPTLRFSNVTRYGQTTNAYVVTNPDDTRGNVVNGFLFRSSKNRNVEVQTFANVSNLNGEFEVGGFLNRFVIGAEFSREESHSQGYYITGPGLPTQPGFAPLAPGTIVVNGAGGCSLPGRTGAAFGYNCTTLDNPNPNDPWIGKVSRAIAYSDVVTEVAAIYAFNTIEFSPQWSLNLGLRYDTYSTRLTGVTAAATAVAPYYTTTAIVPLENEVDFFNYQVGLVYKPTEKGSIYASVATSSNPSGEGGGDFSTVAAATDSLEPEENITYELGTKWELFEGLFVTGAIFRTEKTNARVADPLGGDNLMVGEQRVDGLELSVSGSITSQWSVFGGYTYLKSEILDGGPLNTNEGNAFPNTPENSFTMWTSYKVLPELEIGGGAVYMDERYGDPANTRKVDSYWRYDASASWRVNDRVDVRLNLQNLSDERYALRAFTTHMVQLAPGRSALLTLNLRF